MSSTPAIRFAAVSAVRNAAHFLADYWVQSDHQAVTKGKPGTEGARACAAHVASVGQSGGLSDSRPASLLLGGDVRALADVRQVSRTAVAR